jgi:hypothetical protein
MLRSILFLLPLVLTGCQFAQGWQSYGAEIPASHPTSVDRLLAEPEAFDGQPLLVEGRVADVCPKKGCWMIFTSGPREMRVTFQDYAFFVPMDCAGRKARVYGKFAIVDIGVDEARHDLEDAGKHAEAQALVAPVRSVTLVAEGVQLTDR